jgi:hypothetical protein
MRQKSFELKSREHNERERKMLVATDVPRIKQSVASSRYSRSQNILSGLLCEELVLHSQNLRRCYRV